VTFLEKSGKCLKRIFQWKVSCFFFQWKMFFFGLIMSWPPKQPKTSIWLVQGFKSKRASQGRRVRLKQHTATHCNTLKQTATRWNTLQHTATHCNTHCHTHCNTLQHTATTHCNALGRIREGSVLGTQVVAVWCSVMQCDAVWCSVLQRVAVCCSVLQCVAVCCSVLQRVAVVGDFSVKSTLLKPENCQNPRIHFLCTREPLHLAATLLNTLPLFFFSPYFSLALFFSLPFSLSNTLSLFMFIHAYIQPLPSSNLCLSHSNSRRACAWSEEDRKVITFSFCRPCLCPFCPFSLGF